MNLDEHLGPPLPLRDWLDRLGDFPADGWLTVSANTTRVSLDTICRPIVTNGRDLSDDEDDALEAALDAARLTWFLNEDQLEDIVVNLALQVDHYSPEQLLAAIQYYWAHDAFIELRDA